MSPQSGWLAIAVSFLLCGTLLADLSVTLPGK